LLNPGHFAIYTILSRINDFASAIYFVLDPAILPILSRQVQDQEFIAFSNNIKQYLWASIAWSLLILVGTTLFSHQFIGLFGSYYKNYASVLWLVAMISLIKSILGPGAQILSVSGNEHINLKITAITSVIYIMSSYLLISQIGILGGLFSSIIFQTLKSLTQAYYVKQRTSVGVTLMSLSWSK